MAMELVTAVTLKTNFEKAKNVASMPVSLEMAFTEMISEACSCENGDCEQK